MPLLSSHDSSGQDPERSRRERCRTGFFIFPLTTQSLSDTISPDCMHLGTIARSHRRHAPETQPPASLSRAESRGLSRSTLFSPQPSPHTCKLSNSPALQTANARAFRGYRPATRLRVARPNLLGINTCELVAPSSLQQLLLIQQLPYTPEGRGVGGSCPEGSNSSLVTRLPDTASGLAGPSPRAISLRGISLPGISR